MGGLVTKEVRTSNFNGKGPTKADHCPTQVHIQGEGNINYQNFARSTCAVIFLATPHRGADLAETLDDSLKSMFGGVLSKPYISELRSNSRTLTEINDEFQSIAHNLKIVSFCERRGLGMTGKVNFLLCFYFTLRSGLILICRW